MSCDVFGLTDWQWINEAREWSVGESRRDERGKEGGVGGGGVLRMIADPRTDLWRTTHYGYSYDNAHMFGRMLPGDLRLTATFDADYAEQYDQAGVILRADENNWIKAGVEFVDGALSLSVVVTREFSDWSVLPLPASARITDPVTFDLAREGDAVIVRYGVDGAEPTTMLRLAYFPPRIPILTGVMCAAPVGAGFPVRFTSVSFSS
ncbi:MAG TPA: DUF1349 domain-containing protein [Thermopolyspora sp.]|jgi:Uncharacterized conserved protein